MWKYASFRSTEVNQLFCQGCMCKHPELVFPEIFVQSTKVSANTALPPIWGPENTWSKNRSDAVREG